MRIVQPASFSLAHRRISTRGFTLVEIAIALCLVGLLTATAVPSYRQIIERQKIARCVRDLTSIALQLEKYRTLHFSFPEGLGELGPVRKDPWGFDYQFLNFQSSAPGTNGKVRKDHNLHPLNTEIDLYSLGPDGRSSPPLTAQASQDDVIWARDGAFIGVAADY